MRLTAQIIVTFLTLLTFAMTSGCTLTGLMAGSIIEANRDPVNQVSPKEVRRLEPGERIIIVRTTRESIDGLLLGLSPRPVEEYKQAFAP